jgi:hypothetical protein
MITSQNETSFAEPVRVMSAEIRAIAKIPENSSEM